MSFFKKSSVWQFCFGLIILLLLPTLIGKPTLFHNFQLLKAGHTTLEDKKLIATTEKEEEKVLGRATTEPKVFISGTNQAGGVIGLSTLDEPTVEIGSFDLNGTATIEIFQASKDDLLNYLVHNDEGNQVSRTVDVNNLSLIATTTKEIISGYDKANIVLLAIEGSGIWYLRLKLGGTTDGVFVVRSNIGAILKEGDNQFIFWGQNLISKQRLEGGEIRIYNLLNNISEIDRFSLNSDGLAQSALKREADIGLLEKDNQLALIPINLLYLNAGYSTGYKYFDLKQRKAKFFVFTDRPVYKPGDKLYFKSIIREDDDARYSLPAGSAQVQVFCGNDQQAFFENSFPVSLEGTVFGEIDIPENTATGHCRLTLDLMPGSDNFLLKGFAYFQVEYYRKPEYTIDIDIDKKEFISGDKTSFSINGHFFSGPPLAGQTVKYSILSSDFFDYYYASDTSYALDSDYYDYWGGKKVEEGTANFDQSGEAKVNLALKLPEGEYQSQIFSIEAEYSDASGNAVFSRKNILVYSGEFGIYKNDNLYSTHVGQPTGLSLKIVPRFKASTANIQLKAKGQRINWVKYQDPNKKFPSYREEKEDLPELQAVSDSNGLVSFSFTPEKAGSYKFTMEAKDRRGNLVINEFYIYAVASDQPLYQAGAIKSGLIIQTDKERYNHTQEVKLTINSDIANRDVFLSFDRGRTNRFQLVHLDDKSTTLTLSLEETDIPNIFLKVASFADNYLDNDSKNIIVSADPKKLQLKITTDKDKYRPGETVKVRLKTTDYNANPLSAEAALWVVDKALFELVGTQSLNVFDSFWHERYDETKQTHSLQGINVQMAEGGGGGGGEGRTVFKDTAYWNPSVKTDGSGQADISFKLPDNLTTWLIASVGSTDKTIVGHTTGEIIVSKEVMVRPILPNILRTEDEIILSGLVHNYTDKDYRFETELQFDSGEVKSAKQDSVLVKSNSLTQLYWRTFPSKESEKAKVKVTAKAKDDDNVNDAVTYEIPVYQFGFWEQKGMTGDGPTELEIKLDPSSDLEKSKVTLSLAPTILGTLPSAMKYLVNYPYGCVEQITSQFVPAIIAKENGEVFSQVIADKKVDEIIQEGVNKLKKEQNPDGSWSWWQHSKPDPFISAYVVEYLLKAQKLGAAVDSYMLNQAKNFLSLEQTGADMIASNYGLSLMAEKEKVKHLDNLIGFKADILALAVMSNVNNGDLNPETNGLNQLLSLRETQGEAVFWPAGESQHFGSIDASTALAIRAILAAQQPDRQLAVKASRYLLRNRQSNYWSNTFATAQVIRAVIELSKTGEELMPDYSYRVLLDGKKISEARIDDYKKPIEGIIISGKDIKQNGSKLVIEKTDEEGQLYSSLLIEEFNTDRRAEAVNNGFEVKREYVNEKGEKYALGVGDTVEVRLIVKGLEAEENYGVIVDQLPSGMIAINPEFKSEQYERDEKLTYQAGVSGQEVTENGMTLSLYRVAPGKNIYRYKARVVNAGKFNVPPARAFMMYAPEINGRSETQSVNIKAQMSLKPDEVIKERKTLVFIGLSGLVLGSFAGLYLLRRKKRKQLQPSSGIKTPEFPAKNCQNEG